MNSQDGKTTEAESGRGLTHPLYTGGPQESLLSGFNQSGVLYSDLIGLKEADQFISALYIRQQVPESKPPQGQKLPDLGLGPEAQEELRKVLENFLKAVITGEIPNEKAERVITLFLLSLQDIITGKKLAAIEKLNQVLPILEELDDKTMQAIALANVGGLYAFMGFSKKAIEFLDRAIPLLKAVNERFYLASALNTLGQVYYLAMERRKGLDCFNQALTLFHEVGARNFEVRTLIGIASVHSAMGEYKKALDLLNNAVPLQQYAGKDGEAIMITAIGDVYRDMGDGEKALEYFHQAVNISRAAGDLLHEANALNRLGSLFHYRGEREKAIEYFNRALLAAQATGHRRMEAAVFVNTGAFHHQSGDLHKAIQLYNKAYAIMQAEEDYHGKATCLAYIGSIFNSLGEYQKALDYYNNALAAFRLLEHKGSEANTLLNMGQALGSLGEIARGLDHLDQALKINRSIGDPNGEARTLQTIGEFYALLGNKQQALSNYAQALTIMQRVRDRHGEGGTLGRMAMIYGSLGENQKALSCLSQSLAIARSVADHISEADALSNMGRLYEQQGELTTALGYYRQSIEKRERNRAVARIEEFKIGLASKDAEVYDRTILLEMRVGQHARAFNLVERARARAFLDQLGNNRPNMHRWMPYEDIREEKALALELALLEEKLKRESSLPFSSLNESLIQSLEAQLTSKRRQYEDLLTRLKAANPEYASLTAADTLTLPEVQDLIGEDTTLLSYFVTPDKTLAFVVGKDSFRAVELPVKNADLEAAVIWLRSFPSLRDPRPQALKQLYDWLIAPVKQDIKTRGVAIVPHGVLHYLPFAALTSGKRYFGDEQTIYLLPSASVLPFIHNNSRPVEPRLIAVAQGQAQGLPTLRYADSEAEAVARIYNAQAITTNKAIKADFLKQAGDYSILHIAAHAELNTSSPLFSRIMLAPSEGDTGALEVRDVYSLNLSRVSLVVLSACDTHLGAISKGDDIVGLNRAFHYAGAPTVIASLWTVDDESTSYLMSEFYSNLKGGMGKAEALRNAKAETRRRYPHPFYWAAFVLSGDPGPIAGGTRK